MLGVYVPLPWFMLGRDHVWLNTLIEHLYV